MFRSSSQDILSISRDSEHDICLRRFALWLLRFRAIQKLLSNSAVLNECHLSFKCAFIHTQCLPMCHAVRFLPGNHIWAVFGYEDVLSLLLQPSECAHGPNCLVYSNIWVYLNTEDEFTVRRRSYFLPWCVGASCMLPSAHKSRLIYNVHFYVIVCASRASKPVSFWFSGKFQDCCCAGLKTQRL